MVVAAAQRTNREVWPVAARCSRSCVGASQKGSSAPCVLRQAANVARKSKLIKEGQEKGYQLARTFGFLSLRRCDVLISTCTFVCTMRPHPSTLLLTDLYFLYFWLWSSLGDSISITKQNNETCFYPALLWPAIP